MDIDFDPRKSERNRRDRGFGFGFAARIFLGRTLMSSARVESGEIRMKAVGEIDGTVDTLIFVEIDETRHIISARPASRKKRKRWSQ